MWLDFGTELSKAEAAFDKRFENTFKIAEKGFSEGEIDFAKAAMSNLIGGIG